MDFGGIEHRLRFMWVDPVPIKQLDSVKQIPFESHMRLNNPISYHTLSIANVTFRYQSEATGSVPGLL
jgi:hypothetical protein